MAAHAARNDDLLAAGAAKDAELNCLRDKGAKTRSAHAKRSAATRQHQRVKSKRRGLRCAHIAVLEANSSAVHALRIDAALCRQAPHMQNCATQLIVNHL